MSRLKVLLAEDDQEHQMLLLSALTDGQQQSSMSVLAVDSGARFLEELRRDRYDCVIVDFNLTDYRADELIHKAKDDLGETPVVVISSSDDQTIVIKSLRSGVVDFVPKTLAVTTDALRVSVERAIASARHQLAERRHHERRERCLARIAETDPLTGLFNRRFFQRCLEEGRWANDRRASIACLMVDIDHFKSINDTHGHNAGDQVLCSVAQTLSEQAGGGTTAFRWGGEEFLLLKSASLTEAWSLAEQLRQAVEKLETRVNEKTIKLTASVGLAHGPTDGLNAHMVDLADRALYMAKTSGRNRVCTWQMVELKGIVEELRGPMARQPESTRRALLKRLASSLGPTQWEHLTSHSSRVSQAAERIGIGMGLPPQEVEQIRLGGLYHDMGKCLVPEDLLAQPRRLTDQEWRVMSTHAGVARRMARWLGASEPVQNMVLHHHARYDTPGSHAPLGARVLCAADALVTMLTGRPYARARSLPDALSEMENHRGRQFDPRVIDAADGVDFSLSMAA